MSPVGILEPKSYKPTYLQRLLASYRANLHSILHHPRLQGPATEWLRCPSLGTALVVQWLRFCIPSAGGSGSMPGQGTRSHTLQLKILYATTKTWHRQKKERLASLTASPQLIAECRLPGPLFLYLLKSYLSSEEPPISLKQHPSHTLEMFCVTLPSFISSSLP